MSPLAAGTTEEVKNAAFVEQEVHENITNIAEKLKSNMLSGLFAMLSFI